MRIRPLLAVSLALGLVAACSPWTRATLDAGGRKRVYHFKAPTQGQGPFPVVLGLHGRGGNGTGQDRLGDLMRLVDVGPALVVLPDGIDRSWADARDSGPASEQGVDDVAFVSALIDELVSKRQGDPTRVYLLGMSNGGFMSTTLVCRLSGKLAGAVSVTGAVSENLVADCPLDRPTSIAFIMGEQDTLVPFDGGVVAGDRGGMLGAWASAEFFATRNGCGPTPTHSELADTDPADETRVELDVWTGCREGVEVRLYTVRGGGHTWPAGWQYLPVSLIGRTSKDLDATLEGWGFLKRFTRP